MNVLPEVPQVAVFDTTYHRALDPVHYLYSLPYEYYEKYGVRKYGAHGSPLGRVALHAYKLRFAHPVTRKEMNFETPIPPRFLSITASTGPSAVDGK